MAYDSTAAADPRTGRVRYTVTGVGCFLVEPTERATPGPWVRVTFGDPGNHPYEPSDVLPAAPVIDGHTLIGGGVVRLLAPFTGLLLAVSCAGCGQHPPAALAPVSDDTSHEVQRVLAALLTDWAGRPDLQDLRAAHEQWRAQFLLPDAGRQADAARAAVLAAVDVYDDLRREERRLLRLVDAFDRRTGLV